MRGEDGIISGILFVYKVYHKDTKWDGLIDEPWDWRKKWGEEEEDNE